MDKISQTLSSLEIPGTFDKSIRLFFIPSNSCTMAWYVHWFNSGEIGSSVLSRIKSNGEISDCRKSNSPAS